MSENGCPCCCSSMQHGSPFLTSTYSKVKNSLKDVNLGLQWNYAAKAWMTSILFNKWILHFMYVVYSSL